MLTPKQHELLMFIDCRLRETGCSPSFDEMKEGMCLKSKGGIHRLITALEERGFLVRRHNRARALEVLRLPENLAAGNHSTRAVGTARAGSGRRTLPVGLSGTVTNQRPANDIGVVEVPLHGRIAAGPPVEAPHVTGDYITVPAALLQHSGHQHYALEVVGDSMIGAGIVHGDMVIIRHDATVENGKIAAVSVDGGATLKRIFRYSDEIELESANVRYPTRAFPFERVAVQGQLVALVRRY